MAARGIPSFGREELDALSQALPIAREMTGQFFALSDDWFSRTSHEICTLRDLRAQEILGPGRLALIRRVHRLAEPGGPILRCDRLCPHYRICLQDHNILAWLRGMDAVAARDLLAYVLTHEYVHLVRFDRLEHSYQSFPEGRAQEEARVTEIARTIAARLGPPGLRRAAPAIPG